MSAAGRFVTLEGIEGAGKSTVARFIERWLAERNIPHLLTREPGGTPLAERVRALVLERGAEQIDGVSETLLMFAARGIHLAHAIRPAIARGAWVVCDRFTDATRAYQGGGRGIDAEWIEGLATAVHRGLEPDLTLLLDLPVTTGLGRARARAGAADRFESEALAFHERVRAAYLELARRNPQRIRIVDATQSPGQVEAQVATQLEALARP